MEKEKGRKKRQKITNEIKIMIIEEKEKTKKSDYELADKYKVDRSTITKILAKKEKYLQDENSQPNKKRCRLQNGYYHLVEEALYKWVLLAKSASIILPYHVLKEKAMDFYQKLKSENIRIREGFEASDGWIKKFMNRFELDSKTFTGESESADRSQIEPFKEKFKTICEKYNPDDIYNCDETGLYFRLGPNKTVTLKNENCKGTKKDKSRVTILLTTNITGSRKIKPYVIGKSARPRCMKYTDFSTLPVKYTSNDSAWMTGDKWLKWLKWFDDQLTRPSLLLVDNCSAHVKSSQVEYKNLQIIYLPPNTTSLIQPMDAGIIKNFKSLYRKLLVSHWVQLFDSNKKLDPISIKKCIDFIDDAWHSMDQITIKRCWKNTGILPDFILDKLGDLSKSTVDFSSEKNFEYSLKKLREMDPNLDMEPQEYVDVDESCPVAYTPDDDEIIREVLVENKLKDVSNNAALSNSEEDEEDDEPEQEYVSNQMGYEAFLTFLKFLEQFNSVNSDDLRKIKDIYKKVDVEKLKKLKQITLFDLIKLNN
ncbi:unnamed protein product [Brachionus calyciflorus]|uniref:HTH CENPB-type domain-containing protein n=1 Tax=Brachionus calyciflorus TaxID=104777 RepID=A0A814LQD8_9BILA|nr:unnamed protein product [Brachionus calyciflorus]